MIRRSIFETNSSSSHSLVIKGIEDFVVVSQENIEIFCGEYGWGVERLTHWTEKAAYLYMQSIGGIKGGETANTFILRKVIEDYTQCKTLIFSGAEDSYLDHQSIGNGVGLFDAPEMLKKFIFGTKSYVLISNDNGGEGVEDIEPNAVQTVYGHEVWYV